jgi:SAM-dependent methyltransferase
MDVVKQTVETYDSIAHEYCKKTRRPKFLEWEESYIQTLLSHIANPMPLVLDVGCADGRHCLLIEKHGGIAIGMDLSENMLREARTYYPIGKYCRMDMRDLAFGRDSFDGMWISGSIYHVPKERLENLIRELSAALKTGGVVAVNFKLGIGEGLEENPRSYGGSPRFFAYYCEEEIRRLFEDNGFEELKSCLFPEAIFGASVQQMWFRLNR